MYQFNAAAEDERTVFGSARPGYQPHQVEHWLKFMQAQGIQRICCLLTESQLSRYCGLLKQYQQVFGDQQVCWSPIVDFQLATVEQLNQQILPFLAIADQCQVKVLVHCSGGMGRTGQVLAAWLVAGRGLTLERAIATVKRMGRNPDEAAIAAIFKGRSPWVVRAELRRRLARVAVTGDCL
jgi:protein-tyrosine phosphatase